MRDIEFRAYDPDENVMYFSHRKSIPFGEELNSLSKLFKIIDKYGWNAEQYTGLKDKNGVKIFEGDILFSEKWNPKKQEVTFNRGGFCLKYDQSGYYPDIKYAEQMEVIGNIHEENK